MPFDERRILDITILDFYGHFTFTAGKEMRQRVTTLVAGGTRSLILNLERVSYIDSAGLGAIVESFTYLRGKNGTLRFVNPTERTQHVLEITGITTFIETFASEALAIDSFAAKAVVTAQAEGPHP